MGEASDFRKKVMTSHLFESDEPEPPRRRPDPSPVRPAEQQPQSQSSEASDFRRKVMTSHLFEPDTTYQPQQQRDSSISERQAQYETPGTYDIRQKVMSSHIFGDGPPSPSKQTPKRSSPEPSGFGNASDKFDTDDTDNYPTIEYRDTRIHGSAYPGPPPAPRARPIILDAPKKVAPIVLEDDAPLKSLDAFPVQKFDVPTVRHDLNAGVRRRPIPKLRAPPPVKMTVATDMASLREKATQQAAEFARKMQAQ